MQNVLRILHEWPPEFIGMNTPFISTLLLGPAKINLRILQHQELAARASNITNPVASSQKEILRLAIKQVATYWKFGSVLLGMGFCIAYLVTCSADLLVRQMNSKVSWENRWVFSPAPSSCLLCDTSNVERWFTAASSCMPSTRCCEHSRVLDGEIGDQTIYASAPLSFRRSEAGVLPVERFVFPFQFDDSQIDQLT